MVVSSRAVAALGLGLAGLACLVVPSFSHAQQQADPAVRKTATQAAPAQAVPSPSAPLIGTVDLEAVFKGYDKIKTQQEEFKAAAMAKHNELLKLQSEGQQEAEKLAKFTPGSVDAKKAEDKITELKARIEAGRESAQRDFAMRESDMMAAWYKEVQEMVSLIAQYRKLTYVLQVNNEPISGTNPNSVMAAMSKPVVYADPRNDITKDVIHNLNKRYKAAGGTAPRATTATPAPASARPAGN